ncbi:MAG TPA: hypothetical protein VIG99_28965 [Myxococcaceae bacterium]
MVRRLAFIAAALLPLLLLGCKGSCRQLSEKLCDCQATTAARTSCLQRVASEESRIAPSSADEAVCSGLLDGCDCHQIDTPEGKVACGLARGRPGSQ